LQLALQRCRKPKFVDLITLLRPGYSLPSRKALATTILDKVEAEIEDSITEKMTNLSKTSALTLIQDGWSSIHNDPIIASNLFVDSRSFLFSSTDCGAEKKTSDYCAELALQDIAACKVKYNCEVNIFQI
jgi:hypothetical protein